MVILERRLRIWRQGKGEKGRGRTVGDARKDTLESKFHTVDYFNRFTKSSNQSNNFWLANGFNMFLHSWSNGEDARIDCCCDV
jgi:hypothetical protein